MSLISNAPSGQYRKHSVKTPTFLLYTNVYHGMLSHLDGLQDFKYIINIFGYLVGRSVSENGQCLVYQRET